MTGKGDDKRLPAPGATGKGRTIQMPEWTPAGPVARVRAGTEEVPADASEGEAPIPFAAGADPRPAVVDPTVTPFRPSAPGLEPAPAARVALAPVAALGETVLGGQLSPFVTPFRGASHAVQDKLERSPLPGALPPATPFEPKQAPAAPPRVEVSYVSPARVEVSPASPPRVPAPVQPTPERPPLASPPIRLRSETTGLDALDPDARLGIVLLDAILRRMDAPR